MATAAALGHVLVHGDIHEDQLLATDGELTGILDWETARIDHPFWAFDHPAVTGTVAEHLARA